jgi:hypothetical protein
MRLLFLDTLKSPHKRPCPSRADYELPIQPAITTVSAQDAGQRQLCVSYICARRAWLVTRAEGSMTCAGALEVAIRRLRRSRYPRLLAAAGALAELHRDLIGHHESNVGQSPYADSTSLRAMSLYRDRVSTAARSSS